MNNERIVRIVEEMQVQGIRLQVVETAYEFGRHYVLLMNGEPGFANSDLDRVLNYMRSVAGVR